MFKEVIGYCFEGNKRAPVLMDGKLSIGKFSEIRNYSTFDAWYIHRKNLFKTIKAIGSERNYNRVLDVGCGNKPYQSLIKCDGYIGLEWEGGINPDKSPDKWYDGKHFPFEDESFDTVVMFEVLEHLQDPAVVLLECKRVLKPDGIIIVTVPFLWEEHNQPHDYWRFTTKGLIISMDNFFSGQRFKPLGNSVQTLIQLFNMYVYSKVRNSKILRVLAKLLIFLPLNLISLCFSGESKNLYLSNIYLGRKSLYENHS